MGRRSSHCGLGAPRQARSYEPALRIFLSFLTLFVGMPPQVWASPSGPQVVHGQVQFQQVGLETRITASDRSIINYDTFNIAVDETVRFVQPTSSSWVLNRVISAARSEIDGRLLANGRVALVNPAGIYFGPNAVVDVNRFLAAAASMSDQSFLSEEWRFEVGDGAVINDGEIRADRTFLLGHHILNNGAVIAPDGLVMVAANESALLRNPDGQVYVEVDGKSVQEIKAAARSGESTNATGKTAIENTGNLEGGTVTLFVGDMYAQAFRNAGKVASATTVGQGSVQVAAASGDVQNDGALESDGRVEVTAAEITHGGSATGPEVIIEAGEAGTLLVSGEVDASSDSAAGGTIHLLGGQVGLVGGAQIDASGATDGGTILVGGDYQGGGETPTAQRTFVGSDVTLTADAGTLGDGGKVIVWADDWTKFHGSISATGGSEDGDGGSVEVSGKQNLAFTGSADVTAVNGQLGTVLLDPDNITIVSLSGVDDGNITGGVLFNEGSGTFTISASAIGGLVGDAVLQAGKDITFGEIGLSIQLQANESISFEAGGSIFINDNLSIITGGGNILLSAGDADAASPSSSATIFFGSGTTLDSFDSGAGGGPGRISILNTGTGGISLQNAIINANTEAVRISSGGSISSSSLNITAGSLGVVGAGTVNLADAAQNNVGTVAATVTGSGGIATFQFNNNGNLNVGSLASADGIAATVGIAVSQNGGSLVNVSAPTITVGDDVTGDQITLTANAGNLDLDTGDLTATQGITLSASFTGAQIIDGGNISAGADQQLSLVSEGDLLVGTGSGGISKILNTDQTNLVATSQSGTVTFSQAFTWNSLQVVADANATISGDQTTDSGDIQLSSASGEINLNGSGLASAANLTIDAGPTAQSSINGAGGNLTTGNGNLNIVSGANVTIGSGGFTNIQNSGGISLVVTSDNGDVTFAGEQTFNAVTARAQNDVILSSGNLSTNNGTLSLQAIGGDIDLNNNNLNSSNDLLIEGNAILDDGALAAGADQALSIQQFTALTIGSSGIDGIQNKNSVNLSVLGGNIVTLADAATWNSLNVTAVGNLVVNADQVTDSGDLALTSNSDINLNNNDLTSAAGIALDAGGNTDITGTGGNISVGAGNTLNIQEASNITIGAGGFSNIQNTSQTNLTVITSGGDITFGSQTSWQSLGANATGSVILNAATSTTSGNLDLAAASMIDFNNNALASAQDMSLAATGLINAGGNISVGQDKALNLNTVAAIVIGAGGLTTVLNREQVILNAQSAGDVTLASPFTWNSLAASGRSIIVNADQVAGDGGISFTSNTGSLDLNDNDLAAEENIILNDSLGAGILNTSGNLTVGFLRTLNITSGVDLDVSASNFDRIQNASDTNLVLNSNSAISVSREQQWNSLTASAGTGVNLVAAQSAKRGDIILSTTDGNVNLGGSNITSARGITLSALGSTGAVSFGGADVRLGTNHQLNIISGADLTIGSPGNSDGFQNTEDINLVLTSSVGRVNMVAATTWNSLVVQSTSSDVNFNAAQSTDAGDFTVTAGNDVNVFDALSSAGDMSLHTNAGSINSGVFSLSVGINRNLELMQANPLSIGLGGIGGIQNSSNVDLIATSTQNTLTIEGGTFNRLEATALSDVILTGNVTTDGSSITLTSQSGNLHLGSVDISSATSVGLQASVALLGANAGSLSVAKNRDLQVSVGSALIVGPGGLNNISNPADVSLSITTTNADVTFNGNQTFNSLVLTTTGDGAFNPGNVTFNGNVTTDLGGIEISAKEGDIDLQGNQLISATDLSINTRGTNAGGDIRNATGGMAVGPGRTLTITSSDDVVIGLANIMILNTEQTNLVVLPDQDTSFNSIDVTLSDTATWHSLEIGSDNTAQQFGTIDTIAINGNVTTDFGELSLRAMNGIDLNNHDLAANTAMELQVTTGGISDAGGSISVGPNNFLSFSTQDNLVLGAGGVSGIQNADAVNLAVSVSNGSFTLTSGAVYHSAEISAGSIGLNADLATDTGEIELHSFLGNIDLGGRNITSADDIDVRVNSFGSGGQILNATGMIASGPARDISFTADGDLTIGPGGISGFQNANVTFLSFRSNSGAVTFAGGSNLTALGLEVQAGNGISVLSDLTATSDEIDFMATAGDIDLGNRTIIAGAELDMTASAGSIRNASGAIRSDIGLISIQTSASLTIGAGGISNLQGLNGTDIEISSTSGNVDIVGGLETASVEVEGSAQFTVTGGNISTFTGDIEVNVSGAVNLNGNSISSARDLRLTAGGVTNPGNISVAPNGSLNLTLPSATAVDIGSGGVNTIDNTKDVNFILTTLGPVTFSSAKTWNTLTVTAQNITLAGAQAADGGNISFAATSGDIDLGNVTLTADDDITLAVTTGSVTNAANAIAVGKEAVLSISQSGNLTIGTGGVSDIQNPQDVNLFAFSSAGDLTFTGTTYHSLIGAAQGDVNVSESLVTDGGNLALMALSGDVNLNSNNLTSAKNMSVEATAGDLNNVGSLQTGVDGVLALTAGDDFTIPVSSIQNTSSTSLLAVANGDLTISMAAIWNGLFLQGESVVVGASQTTDANISLGQTIVFGGENISTTSMQLIATAGDIELSGNNLSSATALVLEASSGDITGQTGAELSVGSGQTLGVEVDESLTIGAGGLDSIQDTANVTLEVEADGNLTFASSATWHTLEAEADGQLSVNANQTTNTGNISLKAEGALLDNNALLTSAADITLTATNAGIETGPGSLSVGADRTLSVVQSDSLSLDLNADVLNPEQTNFGVIINSGSLTIAGTSAVTVNALIAFANADVVVSRNITTDAGDLLLEAGNGNVKLSDSDLSSNADMILQAFGGHLLNAGDLAVGSGRNLTLNSDAPLVIGTGGIDGIQNASSVNLSAGSFSGAFVINGNNTWAALELKTQFDDVGGTGNPNNSDGDVILNGVQTTAAGGDINIESAVSIEFAGNNITSGGNMSLETNGNGELVNEGDIAVGANEDLLLRGASVVVADGGGFLDSIQNQSQVGLNIEATSGDASLLGSATWNALTITGATGVIVTGNQTTTGDISLTASAGLIDLAGSDLSAGGNMSLSAIVPGSDSAGGGNFGAGADGEIVGVGTLSVGSSSLLAIAQDEELVLGSGGFDITNTSQVILSATSTFGDVSFTSATTWHTLAAITTGNSTTDFHPEGEEINVLAPQASASGGISFSSTGDLNLLGQALNSNTDISFTVDPDLDGDVENAVGNISLGINGTLTISAEEITIGEGGINRIQNTEAVNLVVTASGDDLAFTTPFTFNSVTARAGDGNQDDISIAVAGPMQTDDGNISLVSDFEIILFNNDVAAAGDLAMTASDGSIRGANVLAAGSGNTITLTQDSSISLPVSAINNADQINLVVHSTDGDVTFENAVTFDSLSATASRTIASGGNLTTDAGTLTLVATNGGIAAAGQDLSASGALTMTANGIGGFINAGDLSGTSVVVSADSQVVLTTVIDGGAGNVSLNAGDLNADGDGLTIQNAADVDVDAESITVTNGDFNVGTNITGAIETGVLEDITVNGDLDFTTTGAGGINLSNATVSANSITLTATAAGAAVQQGTNGSLDVNNNGNDVIVTAHSSIALGTNNADIKLSETSSFMDLSLISTAGNISIEDTAQNLNSFSASAAAAGKTITFGQNVTTDSGDLSLVADGDMDLGNINLSSAANMTLQTDNGSFQNTSGSVVVGVDARLTIESEGNLVFSAGGGGFTGIQNADAVVLVASSEGGNISTDTTPVTFHQVSLSGETGAFISGNITTDNGPLTIASAAGPIDLGDRDLTSASNLTLSSNSDISNAGGAISTGTDDTLSISANAALTISSGGAGFSGIQNTDQVNLSVNLPSGGSLTISDAFTWDSLTVSAFDSITIQGNQNADSGAINLSAGFSSIDAGSNNLAAAGPVSVVANTLNTQSITVGSVSGNNATLRAGAALNMSSLIDGGGGSVIIDAASLNVTTNGLGIQNTNAVDINVAGDLDIDNGNFDISAAGQIDVADTGNIDLHGEELFWTTSAGDISLGNVDLFGATKITMTTAGNFVTGASHTLAVDFDSNDIDLSSFGNLTIGTGGIILAGTIDLIDLDAISNGDVSFTSAHGLHRLLARANGSVNVGSNISTDSGSLVIEADNDANGTGDVNISAGANLSSANDLSIEASDLDLQGTILASGEIDVDRPAGGNVGLGGASGDMTISGSELQRITTTEEFNIGEVLSNLSLITIDGVTAAQSNNFAEGEFVATASAGNVTFTGGASTFNSLDVEADLDVIIDAAVTTDAGSFDVESDFDENNTGRVIVTSSGSMNSSGSDMTIRGADVDVQGAVNAVSGVITLNRLTGGNIGVGAAPGDMQVSDAEFGKFTTTSRLVFGVTGNIDLITVDGISEASSNNVTQVDFDATTSGGQVRFNGGASTFNKMFVFGANGIIVDAPVTNDASAMTLRADSDANGSGTLQITSNGSLNTTVSFVDMQAADFDLAGAVTASTTVFLDSSTAGGNIGLGSAAGDVSVSDSELGQISTSTLNVGDFSTFNLATVDAVSGANSQGFTKLELNVEGTNGDALFSGGASTFNSLEVFAVDDVTVSVGIVTDESSLDLEADAHAPDGVGSVTITSTGTLTTANATIGLEGADIDIQGAVNSGTNTTALDRSIAGTAGIGNAIGNLGISGAELQKIIAGRAVIGSGTDLNSVTVDGVSSANSANIGVLRIQSDNADVRFSGSPSTVRGLEVFADTDISIDTGVTTTGIATFSSDQDEDGSGNFVVGSVGSLNTTANTLNVFAHDVDIQGAINSGNADIGINHQSNTTLGLGNTAGGMTLSGTELQNISTDGELLLGANDSFTTVIVDGVTAAQSANVSAIEIVAEAGLGANITFANAASSFNQLETFSNDSTTINVPVSSTGTVKIEADDEGNGTGNFDVGPAGSLTSANQDITITAHDVNIQGSIDAGTADITINPSASSIDLGDASTGATMTISKAELQTFASDNLSFGDSFTTGITVDNVTSTDLNNIAGTVFLLAGANGSVTFSGAPSSFPTLDAGGADGINVNVDLTTTAGNLLLEGDADSTGSPNNDIDFASGVSLTAGATLILRAMGGVNAAGAINLSANEGVNLDNPLAANGNVTIDADLNNDDGGTLNIPPSGNITTNSKSLNITAADITIAAALDAGTADITIAPSVASTSIAVGDNAVGSLGLDTSEVQFLSSSGTVTIGVAGGNGDLRVQTIDLTGESFDLTLLGGDVTFGDTGQTGFTNTGLLTMPNSNTLRIISTGAIIDANDNIGLNSNLTDITFSGGAGNLLMQAQDSIGDPDDSSGAGIFFLEASASGLAASSANGDIRVSNFDTNVAITAIDSTKGLSTNGGNISLQVGGSVSFGLELAIPTNLGIDTIRSAGGNVLLNSGDIIISAGGGSNAVNSANGDVFFGPTRSMTLGTTVASTYSIDDAELDVVDPGTGPVNLGNQFNIAISLAGIISPANIDTLFINGQQGLDSTNAANTISATNVAIFVHNSIGSTNAIRVDADNLAAVSNVTGDIAIEDVDDVTIANVVVTTGSTIPGLQSTASDITVTSNGDMTIGAQAVAHSNGNLTLTATNGDIELNEDIGSDSGTFNGNVDGNGTGTVHLDAQSGAITADGSSTIKTAGTTILQSATGIGSSANPIDTSTNTIAATSGDDAFINESDAVTIGSSGGIIGLTTSSSNGEIRLTAGGSIVVSNPVSAHGTGNITLAAGGAGSDLTVNANVDTAGGDVSLKSGTGNSALMTISSNVNSGGGNIVLRADTADVSATVEAGNGEILFSTATQDGTRVIDLGTDFVTTLSLNDSELDRLNTNSLLTIGDTNTDDVQIWSSISPSNAANTTLISGDQIEGSSGSTLQAGGILTLDAENGIFGLSGTGNQSFAVDAETLAARSRADASVKITEANNVTIASSNGASSEFNGIEGGNADFEATNTVTISVGIATNGDLMLSAGDDIAGGSNDIDAEGSVTITGDNITIGSITSEGGVNVTATGTLTMSSILDGGGNDVGVTAGSYSALVDGLLVTDANAVTFNTSSISINGGDFNIDNVAGRVDIQGTTSINVAGNHSFIASTRSSVLDLNNADILARNIQLLATSGEVTMSGGQLAVSQDGGQVNIQQSAGLSISESSIVLGGDTSFMDLNILSNNFVSFFAGLRLSNALHLNSVSAVGNSSGVFVDGVLLVDNAINLTSSSGSISAGVNPIIAGGLLTISALGSSGSNIHAGTLSGVGVNLTAGETITLARSIDANGGSVNISATTLRGRNGLEIRNANGVSIGAQVQLDSGIFTINGVNQNVNTAIKVTGIRTPTLEEVEANPTILEVQTLRSIRVVDEVTRTFEANKIINDIQALNSLAETLESSPDSFGSLLKTNPWLREAQSVIDYTREMLRNAGKEPSIAGEIFIQLYCSDLVETHPEAFKLLKGLADPEDGE